MFRKPVIPKAHLKDKISIIWSYLHMSYRKTFLALASSSHAAAFHLAKSNFKKASYYQYALLQPYTMPRNATAHKYI